LALLLTDTPARRYAHVSRSDQSLFAQSRAVVIRSSGQAWVSQITFSRPRMPAVGPQGRTLGSRSRVGYCHPRPAGWSGVLRRV